MPYCSILQEQPLTPTPSSVLNALNREKVINEANNTNTNNNNNNNNNIDNPFFIHLLDYNNDDGDDENDDDVLMEVFCLWKHNPCK
uniref:Uncharacterized protein n=1 Tax=Octopus bimaculoides TaxID=37653 RepID=A0A0L8GYW8_OCTBM